MIKSIPDTILIVDDEQNLRTVLKAQISRAGYKCITASNGKIALDLFNKNKNISCIVTDLKMPIMDGLHLMKEVHSVKPSIPIIILTAFGTINNAVEAVKAGAFDYIEKPFDKTDLMQTIDNAVATFYSTRNSAASMKIDQIPGRFGIIGDSPDMKAVFTLIEKVSKSDSTVLITGESGTGKELVAKALHDSSLRSKFPFIKVNCAAIPENLLESELFGHEKGAFTGAVNSKPGKFELANNGTILLDEIVELPLSMQAKLLRILQENEYERVGGISTIKSNARILASTNKDLLTEIKNGNFREDLYYRLNVVPIKIPPLRKRATDIPLLIEYFLKKNNSHSGIQTVISQKATSLLKEYKWPGNIRELENVMERTVLLTDNSIIDVDNLPSEIISGSITNGIIENEMEIPDSGLKEVVKRETHRIEKDLIEKALESTNGNITRAANLLRISRKGLQNKIKELLPKSELEDY